MPIKLEVGKDYLDRTGRRVRVTGRKNCGRVYSILGNGANDCYADGRQYGDERTTGLDLVREITKVTNEKMIRAALDGKEIQWSFTWAGTPDGWTTFASPEAAIVYLAKPPEHMRAFRVKPEQVTKEQALAALKNAEWITPSHGDTLRQFIEERAA